MAALSVTLVRFLESDDFRSGVISATKASWGGGGLSVELFDDGMWTILSEHEIGGLGEAPGMLLRLPTVEWDDLEAYVESGGGSEDAFLSEAFDAAREELKADLRGKLSYQLDADEVLRLNHLEAGEQLI